MEQALTASEFAEYLSDDEISKITPLLDRLKVLEEQKTSQDNYLKFVKKIWPTFIEGKHHKIYADKLQKVADGKIKRLIVNMPPRHTKSEFASYLFPAWLMGRRPDLKIIQATHTAELAVGFGRKVKNLIDSDDFRDIFPDIKLASDAKASGRWGGADKINLQNLPSRGPNGKKLKKAIIAPKGYTIVEADSAQIEARVLAWFAGQDELTTAFANGEDVYVKMAARIYNCEEGDVTKDQRFVGKTTILGAGYGMGAEKFGVQLKTFGFEVPPHEARRIIQIYRDANYKISKVWRDANYMVQQLANGRAAKFGRSGIVTVDAANNALIMPNGLSIFYEQLYAEQAEKGLEHSYKTRRGRTRIYGGKVIENVCQALARCIIGEQMLRISKKYKVVLTVHDSIVCCVPDEEVDGARQHVETCMRETPDWAAGLPIDCESGIGKSYGDCE